MEKGSDSKFKLNVYDKLLDRQQKRSPIEMPVFYLENIL